MSEAQYDIAIIGGGINGCGIARDAAGRGLKVFLAEKNDLGSGTSSASTKLVHGGLRYLEHYEFALVRESLVEREVLLSMAPHIIWPMRFILPHHRALRPAWLIRMGLFLYDHLGGRKILPASRGIDLRRDPAGEPLKAEFTKGFEYSDCWVDDARLVVLNALDASRRGADIRVRAEVTSATRENGQWAVQFTDRLTKSSETVTARILINAAGPWIADVVAHRLGQNGEAPVRLVKGSHIVVGKLFDDPRAFIFQNEDRRIIFAIPYQDDFTLIGTTDVDLEEDLDEVAATPDEVSYLCASASEYFNSEITPDDVVWTYSGVRPLYDDGEAAAQETTRDYVLDLHGQKGEPALLNIYGGKITTFRHLAEEVLEKLDDWLSGAGKPWTRDSVLPGGDFSVEGYDDLVERLLTLCPVVERPLARRLARAYGTAAHEILDNVRGTQDLGHHFGAGLYQREVEYLIRNEWAASAEDILWRRSKLGLQLTEEERQAFAAWMKDNYSAVLNSAA